VGEVDDLDANDDGFSAEEEVSHIHTTMENFTIAQPINRQLTLLLWHLRRENYYPSWFPF